jgi:hypothetical protein
MVKIDSERSRIRAALVNSGKFSFDEADKKIAASNLAIVLSEDVASTPAGQAAFLTAVAAGVRCFGKVNVSGALDCPVILPMPMGSKTLRKASAVLGARPSSGLHPKRTVFFGQVRSPVEGWSLQAFWNGWNIGIAPATMAQSVGRSTCALAGIAAGALAVGHAFFAEQGDPRVGRTIQQISLWVPDTDDDGSAGLGPETVILPKELWLIGLGNLGQAYLWSLSMLPYPEPCDVLLFLQDDESIEKENWGTSILVKRNRYGLLKTRVAEMWAEGCKFQVRRIDRRLDEFMRRTEFEPIIALAGLDRISSRRLLGLPGFEYIIDGGLGATAANFQQFRVNVFDREHNPADHFSGIEDRTEKVSRELMELPAYRDLAQKSKDGGCGVAMLAEKSVAVPFVSAFVGALVVTQAIRYVSGYAPYFSVTGNLGELRTVRTNPGGKPDRVKGTGALVKL